MSSLYKENSGWRLQFDLGEKRYKIRLGKLPQKNAETIQSRVNELVNAKDGNYSYSQESARWLSGIGDDLHEKLASVGLIAPRQSRNLAAFLEAYKSERTDWKPSTLGAFNTAAKHLLEFFGEIRLRDVTPEKADAYRSHLIQEGYATAFVSKLITQARNYFNVAKRRKLVDENSFMEVKAGSQVNKNRDYIVSDDEAEALINACSNAEQRLIIALGFYAGLRIPSELGGLRLSEIIWDTNPDNGISRDRFIIHAPKTEKKGKPTRCCPIFPKLKPYFLDVIETMPEGQDLIFSGYAKRKSMGSFFDRLAKKAGITLWTKPAQNLRLTASNRVVREFGVICESEWIGHSQEVAKEHYLRVQLSDYEIADSRTLANKGFSKMSGGFSEKRIDNQSSFESEKQELKPSHGGGAFWGAESVGNTSQNFEPLNKNALFCDTLQNKATGDNTKNGRYGV